MRSIITHKYAILLMVWILSALYVGTFIDRGWIPHDEGSLAHSAERVRAGELPHRDLDEIYTGGLSFLYAATFNLLGANLLSIRYVFFAFFLLFIPATSAVALRFASSAIAAAITALVVVWSVQLFRRGSFLVQPLLCRSRNPRSHPSCRDTPRRLALHRRIVRWSFMFGQGHRCVLHLKEEVRREMESLSGERKFIAGAFPRY